jgi:hypothetical protein
LCGLVALVTVAVYSCKKTNGIDNNNVIQTPFSLFFSDTAGAMYVTNDGRTFNNFLFPPDGKACRALSVSGNNILWAKTHMYYSNNNGRNFNLTYDTLTTFPDFDCVGRAINTNQSMLLNVSAWDNRVYTLSNANNVANWLGVLYSDNNGNPKTWALDGSYDTMGVGILPVRMTSYTFLADGTLCGLAYSGPAENDLIHNRNFVKAGKDGDIDYANRWKEVTANPDNIPYLYNGNLSGTPLPPYGAFVDTAYFYLGHFNNRLIAIDASCHYLAYYSDDKGKNWKDYSTGLPPNTSLLCIESPFEEVCLLGTAGKGLYILNIHTGAWEPNNKGLGSDLIVRNIAAKKNVYKNGNVRKFIYIATNKGIYESADGGRNWTQTIPGNFVAVY